jgi:hypothetical protein
MTPEQRDLRTALERLADDDGGRRLLQLSLRGIESDGRQLVSGCWTRKGDAGCLFQHAYWQGVAEGAFPDDGRARAWVSGVAGRDAYHLVIDAIAAFDRLAKAEFATELHRLRPPELDRERWRGTVSELLVEVLGDAAAAPAEPVLH